MFTPQLGRALAEIQDLEHQAMLAMVWVQLLEPTAPQPNPPVRGSVVADGVDSTDGA